jgi:hypothetical protein
VISLAIYDAVQIELFLTQFRFGFNRMSSMAEEMPHLFAEIENPVTEWLSSSPPSIPAFEIPDLAPAPVPFFIPGMFAQAELARMRQLQERRNAAFNLGEPKPSNLDMRDLLNALKE